MVHMITLLLSLSLSLSLNTPKTLCSSVVVHTWFYVPTNKKYTHYSRVANLVLRYSRQYGALTNRVTDTTHAPKYTHEQNYVERKLDANTKIRTNSYYNNP